ncbi:hypothetical protein [Actinomyces viscosus]|uniref:hypothetical protein n=1 Tax=Actinomyces viscosus TaxID=1656 RepID=UPI001E2DF0F0|nr:hypothetical protein [Actinomyces viscosus]
MTPSTTSTTLPPRTADSPLSGSPAGAPSPAEAPSRATGWPSARSPEAASSTSSRTRSLYSTETTRPARSITGAGPLLSRPSRPALSARRFLPPGAAPSRPHRRSPPWS